MSIGLRRRTFLAAGGRAALGAMLLPTVTCSRSRQEPSPPAGTSPHVWVAELEAQIPRLMADAAVPGVSIALVRDAQILWARGFGVMNSASKEPVGNETVFPVGSMSKPVFAYAVLKLCEAGVIGLDVPLTKYSPVRVIGGDQRLDRMTARHVLSHTGGFQNWRSSTEPLSIHFDPGTQWLYSGEGYSYLQSVVTHLTGSVNTNACGTFEADVKVCASDIAEYLERRVLVPFGMASSSFTWHAALENRLARPHDVNGILLPSTRAIRPPPLPPSVRHAMPRPVASWRRRQTTPSS